MENEMNMDEILEKLKKLERIRELARARNHRYYHRNKEKIKEKMKLKSTPSCICECGGKYQQRFISVHIKTKRHKRFLEYQGG